MRNEPYIVLRLLFCALVSLALSCQSMPEPVETPSVRGLVIAHRGASGYLPEHTLAAYAMAHAQGADFIEPDVVRTRDGAFICLHDIHLEATTDVEEVYPERRREDGRWYASDFDLAEIRKLRVHERRRGRFPKQLSGFGVPTFEGMIELVQGLNRSTGRNVGIYPELKAPAWHREAGLAMEERFLEILHSYGYYGSDAAVQVQSFEAKALRKLRALGSALPQILLIGGGDSAAVTESGLDEFATYADGIGPSKNLVESNPRLVEWAHARGLVVHPYTFRADDVPRRYDSLEAELEQFFGVYEVDGVFTDHPDRVRAWIDSRP